MNTFVASVDGRTIATVNDDILRGTMVNDLVIACLRSGLQVHYTDEPPAPAPLVQTYSPVRIRKPKPKQLPEPKRHTKRRKVTRPESIAEFHLSERVYLAWSQLDDKLKTHMSQYRMTAGVIEEFRRGLGIQKTCGVRFNGDPELTWLRPAELTIAPVYDLGSSKES